VFVSRASKYALYVASKCLRGYGFLVAVELVQELPVVVFGFLTLLLASVGVVALQRPWKFVGKVDRQQWLRVVINGVFLGGVWLIWAKGLQECGCLRAIILQYSHVCVAGILAYVFRFQKGAARKKNVYGEVLFLCGFLLLLFHSTSVDAAKLVKDKQDGLTEELGLVWGLLLLVTASLLGAVRGKFATKVAKDIGGTKRLHAFSLVVATISHLPLVFLDFLGEAAVGADYDYSVMSYSTLSNSIIVALLVIVLEFYTEALGSQHIPEESRSLMSVSVSFICSLGLIKMGWNDHNMMDLELYFLPLVVSWVFTVLGLLAVSKSGANRFDGGKRLGLRSMYDSHIGISGWIWKVMSRLILAQGEADDPFVRMPSIPAIGKSSHEFSWSGFRTGSKKMIKHITSSSDSRKIVIFLLMNLAFMFVEVVVGMWTNSLGLISDAGHMFFDCTALFIGLFASFVSKWKPDEYYTYGYGRFETVCGFINGVFLVFIAVFIMTESLERLSEPPELSTSGLLSTSIIGFLINMVGLVFFHDHSHLGSGEEGCSHSHESHGHSHDNDNMHGVFLHILADALGSLGVIVSSLLIQFKGWYIADPLCSLMISVLILMSVYPLLQSTAKSLLLIVPNSTTSAFKSTLENIMRLENVIGIREPNIWTQQGGYHVVSLHVVVADVVQNEQLVLREVENTIRNSVRKVKFCTVSVYTESTFRVMADSIRTKRVPLFWDPVSGALIHSSDGLLSAEQKAKWLNSSTAHSHGHSHSHSHSHSHGHGHSHGSSRTKSMGSIGADMSSDRVNVEIHRSPSPLL